MNIESQLTGLPMNRVADLKEYINHSVPKVMGVDYVGHITEARIELDGYFNNDIDVTTSKPFPRVYGKECFEGERNKSTL